MLFFFVSAALFCRSRHGRWTLMKNVTFRFKPDATCAQTSSLRIINQQHWLGFRDYFGNSWSLTFIVFLPFSPELNCLKYLLLRCLPTFVYHPFTSLPLTSFSFSPVSQDAGFSWLEWICLLWLIGWVLCQCQSPLHLSLFLLLKQLNQTSTELLIKAVHSWWELTVSTVKYGIIICKIILTPYKFTVMIYVPYKYNCMVLMYRKVGSKSYSIYNRWDVAHS